MLFQLLMELNIFGLIQAQRRANNLIDIIHKDEHLLVVNKPPGLLSVPGKSLDKQDCLINRLHSKFSELLVVHRLDMDTSGLIIFARSLDIQRKLSSEFEKRKIKKKYIAWVEGKIAENDGEINLPIRKDMNQSLPPMHVVDYHRGKQATTRWQVSRRDSLKTRLELFPLTGRSHQLRVHLKEIGHPIIGDPIYGTPKERMMLHSSKLTLNHPKSGLPIELEATCPF